PLSPQQVFHDTAGIRSTIDQVADMDNQRVLPAIAHDSRMRLFQQRQLTVNVTDRIKSHAASRRFWLSKDVTPPLGGGAFRNVQTSNCSLRACRNLPVFCSAANASSLIASSR